jgi:hypothetical protein
MRKSSLGNVPQCRCHGGYMVVSVGCMPLIINEEIQPRKSQKLGGAMKKQKLLYSGLILAIGTFGCGVVFADNCSGVDVLVTQTAETTELAKNHTITVWKAHSVLVSPDSIYDNTSGECSGTILSTPDGKTQSMGYCARLDKDGDTVSISWHQGPGADKGVWKSTGGSGKFAGRRDSGWYQAVMANGAMSSTKWGGNCR